MIGIGLSLPRVARLRLPPVVSAPAAAPNIISGSTFSVYENTPLAFTMVADIANVSWSIQGTDAASFEVNGSTLRFAQNGTADFETKASYGLSYLASDPATGLFSAAKALTITILDQDEIPDSFSFTPITGATASTLYQSDPFTVSGLGSGVLAPISITGGGLYRKNVPPWTSAAGTVVNGDSVRVRLTTGATSGAYTTTLNIGGVMATYSVTVGAPAVTLDPANKASGITLSNGNLSATNSGDGNALVRFTKTLPKNSGFYYFEITLTAWPDGYGNFGGGYVLPASDLTFNNRVPGAGADHGATVCLAHNTGTLGIPGFRNGGDGTAPTTIGIRFNTGNGELGYVVDPVSSSYNANYGIADMANEDYAIGLFMNGGTMTVNVGGTPFVYGPLPNWIQPLSP